MQLDEQYWSNRYQQGSTPWDIGEISTPIKEYIDQLEDKELRILIPGCGNAHEAGYCYQLGFKNTYIIDIAIEPLESFGKLYPKFPKENVIHGDFFELKTAFDIIIEQTFFCALHPTFRELYVTKMSELLQPNGKLVGLLFNDKLNIDKPPFGGTIKEYHQVFNTKLLIKKMEVCYNSIPPRRDREFFIIMSTL